jgi:hypothetical protein
MAHIVQAVLPAAAYWPAMQESHDDTPETSLLYWPTAQSVHELATTPENLPAGQIEHG